MIPYRWLGVVPSCERKIVFEDRVEQPYLTSVERRCQSHRGRR